MERTLIIEGGTIVTDQEQFRADLVISGERIQTITTDARGFLADQRIDATGLLVMPGGIDAGTHFHEPDEFTKEGFASGSAAAAAGGITTVVEMPQADPTTVTAEQFRAKRDLVARASVVDMALWGGIIGEPRQELHDLQEMTAEGVAAFISFMIQSNPSFPAVDTTTLLAAMRTVADLGLPYGLHAEDDRMVQTGIKRMQRQGRTDPRAHAESRPPIVEAVAVNTALLFAETTDCWVHFCTCASAEALRLITDARLRGVKVTVETTPQYLRLTTDDLDHLAGFGRCAPALREPTEVDAIWSYVLDETIDFVCSDHYGIPIEAKETGDEDIFKAPLGLPGVQTLLPAFYDSAVHQRNMSLPQFVRQISTNPAQIFGLYPRKGSISLGADADLVLFDPEREWTVRGNSMYYRQEWSPFEGQSLTGRVRQTIRRGQTIYDESGGGEPIHPTSAGFGRFLPRGYGNRD